MIEDSVIKGYIRLSGIKHYPVTIKDNCLYLIGFDFLTPLSFNSSQLLSLLVLSS